MGGQWQNWNLSSFLFQIFPSFNFFVKFQKKLKILKLF